MDSKKNNWLLLSLAITVLSGCGIVPVQATPSAAQPQEADDAQRDIRAQTKDAQRVVSYFNKLNPPLVRVDRGGSAPKAAPVKITIQGAITKYVPNDYKVTTANQVDPQTVITYDTSLPWIEALGKGLAGVSLELGANMYKKAVLVKPYETSLTDIIEQHVPKDYKVFTDAEVNVDSLLRYDERDHWADALGKSGNESGLDITANLTRKLIVIKPMVTTNKDDIKKP